MVIIAHFFLVPQSVLISPGSPLTPCSEDGHKLGEKIRGQNYLTGVSCICTSLHVKNSKGRYFIRAIATRAKEGTSASLVFSRKPNDTSKIGIIWQHVLPFPECSADRSSNGVKARTGGNVHGYKCLLHYNGSQLLYGYRHEEEFRHGPKLYSSLSLIGMSQAFTGLSVVYYLVNELKLQNTDVGRLTLATAVVTDLLNIIMITISSVTGEKMISRQIIMVWAFITTFAIVILVLFVFRPIILGMIRNTPAGKPVDQKYIFIIIILTLVLGFVSKAIGQHYIFGPALLGLIVPDGPPLGAALVARLDTFILGFLCPTYLAISGLQTNIYERNPGKYGLLGSSFSLVSQLKRQQRATIVIMPFHKQWAIDGGIESSNASIRRLNKRVLEKAHCSVGVLVDRGILKGSANVMTSQSKFNVAIIYLSGPDDAKALEYAARMAKHEQ
ncbi:hypothetical protein GH714_037415 [Hevea brasiliensis]|uniref:Uncharacterized protein n=1 Tax=Hevea brasiliensis TaxID=3981 RepID=A0A6A6L799_HEVBR|nr:hypothetical protein GH714_037415 [Hevea brasiliensis]